MSVQVAQGTQVVRVDTYNRADADASLLGKFDVWVGSKAGKTSSKYATRCGSTVTAAPRLGPFSATCSRALVGEWVTIKQSRGESGWLTLGEIEGFTV